jgi:arabinofuranosyltransferase
MLQAHAAESHATAPGKGSAPPRGALAALAGLLVLLFAVVLVRTAWVSDDAYISFRTIENALHGHGLRWNIAERVQTYTHPLWMLLVMLGRAISGEIYFTVLAISGLLTFGTLFVLAVRLAKDAGTRLLLLMALVGSRAFVDYATSGLENPLTHLLLVLFALALLRPGAKHGTEQVEARGPARLRTLALLAALAMLNRMDSILLLAPALGLVALQLGPRRAWRPLLLGFVPMLLWMAFSLLYYGTPWPNTAYAKAFSTGIPTAELAAQSVHAFRWVLVNDPLTPLTILAGLGYALWRRERWLLALAAGVLLQLLYVVKVGGDFMGGRFFAAPFVTSLAILSQARLRADARGTALRRGLLGVAVLFGISAIGTTPTWLSGSEFGDKTLPESGVTNERAFYYGELGLLSPERKIPVYDSTAKLLFPSVEHDHILLVYTMIGVKGYEAGPRVHFVDLWLCDPLLARLPVFDLEDWRIGHFPRRIPHGYLESLVSGKDEMHHEGLGRYYANLRAMTRAPLFSSEWLRGIWRYWRGTDADGLRRFVADEYRDPPQIEIPLRELSKELPAHHFWFDGGMRFLGDVLLLGTLRVQLPELSHAPVLQLGLDRQDIYRLRLLRGDQQVGEIPITTEPWLGGLQPVTVPVPPGAREAGYDAIWIDSPISGDGISALGYLELLEG